MSVLSEMHTGITSVCQKKEGGSMTTVAVTKETTGRTAGRRRRKPKPTTRLVARLERELGLARSEVDLVILAMETDANQALKLLRLRNDELMQALNEHDNARGERDLAISQLKSARESCVRLMGEVSELSRDLRRIHEAHSDLAGRTHESQEKAYRNGEVAAVLASCLVEATGEDPLGIMNRFAEAAERMGVSPEVLAECETALKRGYNAQIEQVINIVAAESLNENNLQVVLFA
jgi:hypothetical protein